MRFIVCSLGTGNVVTCMGVFTTYEDAKDFLVKHAKKGGVLPVFIIPIMEG